MQKTAKGCSDSEISVLEVDEKKSAQKKEAKKYEMIGDATCKDHTVATEVSVLQTDENTAVSEKHDAYQEKTAETNEEKTQEEKTTRVEQVTQADKAEEAKLKPSPTTQTPETTKTPSTTSQTKSTKKSVQETIAAEKPADDDDIIVVDGVKYRAQPHTKITYYCPCYQCSEGYGRGTSSGATATAGRTVAMPAGISFGTKIYYNGHTYICEDRGGAITAGHIDIFCDTHSECGQHSDSGTYQTIYIEVK